MKIRAIRYQNFRQFAERGEVKFDTEGKVTIVYGTNGDGKTTLHQLFRWILYKRVTFNKTTSDSKLYNLGNGARLFPESSLVVWGEIEFEHEGLLYIVRREYTYYKQKNGVIIHKSEDDQFYVQKRTENYDWKFVENPEALIEDVLPSGLSPYFFFDGETMIADLRIRGSESAKSLRTALYSLFDLEAYEKAVYDIGEIGRSQSVIGQLEVKRLKESEESATESKHRQYLKEINILAAKIEAGKAERDGLRQKIEELQKRLDRISEEIGTSKSKKQLETIRKSLVDSKKREHDRIDKEMLLFGNEIETNYAYLLISEVVKSADTRLYMQVQDEEKKIIPGLTKELLINLLRSDDLCLCGRTIGESERKQLEQWKSYFPPTSYKATYDKFRHKAVKYAGKYDSNKLFDFLRNILQYKKNIVDIENQIVGVDEQLQKCGNIDDLLRERNEKEREKSEKEGLLNKCISDVNNWINQCDVRRRFIINYDKSNAKVAKYQRKIEFMQQVAEALKETMKNEVKDYSSMLEKEIQILLEKMMTTKRDVHLSEDFQLQVMDSYSDESKSEGQFAVVSFAYIGGVFKVLKSHKKLETREYPLVLDGPFSKLDPVQKQNVITVLPEYAPQVVIFSKDPLDEFISDEKVGRIWTILSNKEKNEAVIKEGYWWK